MSSSARDLEHTPLAAIVFTSSNHVSLFLIGSVTGVFSTKNLLRIHKQNLLRAGVRQGGAAGKRGNCFQHSDVAYAKCFSDCLYRCPMLIYVRISADQISISMWTVINTFSHSFGLFRVVDNDIEKCIN